MLISFDFYAISIESILALAPTLYIMRCVSSSNRHKVILNSARLSVCSLDYSWQS